MKDLSIYFSPIVLPESLPDESIGTLIHAHTEDGFPDLLKGAVALLYVPEFRNGMAEIHEQFDDRFRNAFYSFFAGANWKMPLVDLGNLLPGERVEDTYFALKQITAELVKENIIPVVIGGTQDLTYAMYQGYEALEQMINVSSIDYRLDLGDPESPVSKDAYVNKLLMHRPCFLFNYSVLGYQTPLVKQSELDLFDKLYFDTVRLGEINANFKLGEPILRNTDMLTIDLQAIRASDFNGRHYNEPNGFQNQEVCQLAKYAGISDKLTALGIFNLIPGDLAQSAHNEVAQIIWYFLDGVSQRVGDFPLGSKKPYTKFTVYLDEIDHEIIFFKSDKSARWWMEVPYPPVKGVKFERHHMVPCNKEDYDHALLGEIPNLWWKTYQKLG
jgi:formiminoglutamase